MRAARSGLVVSLVGLGALAGCVEPTDVGPASSSAHAGARSATTIVANVQLEEPFGDYRLWRIEIGADAPGTDCANRGDALVAFDVYTIFNSAPRGEIVLSTDPPPVIFPAAFAAYANGSSLSGTLVISAASTTGVYGDFAGRAILDGTPQQVVIEFAAPTCDR